MRATVEERFWAKVAVGEPDECWLWTAAATTGSRGRVRRDPMMGVSRIDAVRLGIETKSKYPTVRAAKISLILDGRPPANGQHAHHKCETALCVNPRHLQGVFLGDHMEIHYGELCQRGHLRAQNRWPNGRRGCYQCEYEHGQKETRKKALENAAAKAQLGLPPRGKLSDDDVRSIRRDPRRYKDIASDYGIHRLYVGQIKNRKVRGNVAD